MQKRKYQDDLTVITKAKELSKYIFTIAESIPKKFRFSLVQRMQNISLEIISKLYEANEVFVEISLIKDINKTIDGIKNTKTPNENEYFYTQNKLLQLKLTRAVKLEERVGKRLDCSYRALTLIKELDHVFVVSKEMQCISFKQHEVLSGHIFDLQNLIGAFIKSDKLRFNY